MIIEIIGWFGAFLLATCGLPQMIKTFRTWKFEGLSIIFIIWWLLGEILVLTYVLYKAFKWPLIFNYGINILVCVAILSLYFKINYHKKLKIK